MCGRSRGCPNVVRMLKGVHGTKGLGKAVLDYYYYNSIISKAVKIIKMFFLNYSLAITVSLRENVIITSVCLQNILITDEAFQKFLKWPLCPKPRDFKIIHNIFPTSQFWKKRFKFEVDRYILCNETEETMCFSFVLFQTFCSDIKNWASLKIKDFNFPTASYSVFMVHSVFRHYTKDW